MNADKSNKYIPRISLYVMMLGWVGAFVYTVMLLEYYSFQEILEHFLSTEHSGIRFRAFIFFSPMIATALGYLIYEREKVMDEIRSAREEAEKANVKLEEMLRQKELFINRLGHDLKTPITPLATLLPIVRKKIDDPELGKLLDVNIANVSTLKELVIKNLKLARVKSGKKLELVEIQLRMEVDRYVLKREPLLERAKLNVNNMVGSDVVLRADRVDIEELFYNLISNAMKYSPETTTITIGAAVEGPLARCYVRDEGRGLSKQQKDRVFDEFYKVDESRHDLNSSGLGLAICKNIVENHGGKIWVESGGLNKGTTFFFTLPIAESSPEGANG